MNIPSDVTFILDNLIRHGFESCIVGGCVRDCIMGKTPKDWDITTNALPKDVKTIFRKTIDTGLQHGTVTVLKGGNSYEVTTYRIDGKYLDGRHPEEVFFTPNLEDDLMRRDFTMNSIAYHKNIGFVDPFDGINDIQRKIIKGVGEPNKRFQEDALRMMRAIRFSAQLSFEIEQKTYIAIKQNAYLIKKISIERIRDEFCKTLLSDNPFAIKEFVETGLWQHIHCDSKTYMERQLYKTLPYIPHAKKEVNLRLSLLLMDLENKKVIEFLKYFRFSNETIKSVSICHEWLKKDFSNTTYHILNYLNVLDLTHFQNILYAKSVVAQKDGNSKEIDLINNISEQTKKIIDTDICFKISQLKINGTSLQSLGVENGKHMGQMLTYLLDAVMKDPLKNHKETLEGMVIEKMKKS